MKFGCYHGFVLSATVACKGRTDDLVSHYNKVFSSSLDSLVAHKIHTVCFSHLAPRYTLELRLRGSTKICPHLSTLRLIKSI